MRVYYCIENLNWVGRSDVFINGFKMDEWRNMAENGNTHIVFNKRAIICGRGTLN